MKLSMEVEDELDCLRAIAHKKYCQFFLSAAMDFKKISGKPGELFVPHDMNIHIPLVICELECLGSMPNVKQDANADDLNDMMLQCLGFLCEMRELLQSSKWTELIENQESSEVFAQVLGYIPEARKGDFHGFDPAVDELALIFLEARNAIAAAALTNAIQDGQITQTVTFGIFLEQESQVPKLDAALKIAAHIDSSELSDQVAHLVQLASILESSRAAYLRNEGN